MRKNIAKTISALGKCTSGNAAMLVGLGMPMLIGAAGLGTDLAQWYMWKRELQFAVDQAAVAGAWAAADSDTADTYVKRAEQEFAANLSVTSGITSSATVQLADYAGATDNSVSVHATATKKLPFSNFVSGTTASIYAYAQASFEPGITLTSCLTALDEEMKGAITIGGNSVLTASCGLAALSTDALAVLVNGRPTVDAGWIVAAGGIDEYLKTNTDDVILENQTGLVDPFDGLEPPDPAESQVSRTYSCSAEPDSTHAYKTVRTVNTYSYYQGSGNNISNWDNPDPEPDSDSIVGPTYQVVPNGTVDGTTQVGPRTFTTKVSGVSGNKYQRRTETIWTTFAETIITPGTQAGTLRPGTYDKIHIACDTAFSPGVYYIGSGGLKITGQYQVTGSPVMFVLENGGWIDITGGSNINLTAMQAADLMSLGLTADEANELAGMLVFESRDNGETNKNKLNGNASTVLNGTLYFPVSPVFFAGTVTVTSQCLMIAAKQIVITGTTNMSTFCPPNEVEDDVVLDIAARVKLVA